MKNRQIKIALFLLLALGYSAIYAWPTGGKEDLSFLHIHQDMSKQVVNHPIISFYIDTLKLDKTTINHYACIEPQHIIGYHPDWCHIEDSTFLDFQANEKEMGALIHSLSDFGVPASHKPAEDIWINSTAERVCELTMENYAVPGVDDYYEGDLIEVMDQFYQEQTNLAKSYKKWWKKTWYCPLCNPNTYAKQGIKYSLKFAVAVLKIYFEANYPEMEPPSLPADSVITKAPDNWWLVPFSKTTSYAEQEAMYNLLFESSDPMVNYNNEKIFTAPNYHPIYPEKPSTESDLITKQQPITLQNSPNPFNPITTLIININQEEEVLIQVFNLLGREIETLYSGQMVPGKHQLIWNGAKHPSGYYMFRLVTETQQITHKCFLLK